MNSILKFSQQKIIAAPTLEVFLVRVVRDLFPVLFFLMILVKLIRINLNKDTSYKRRQAEFHNNKFKVIYHLSHQFVDVEWS